MDLRRYFNERDRRTAQNVYGIIASRNADGSYRVRLWDTNEIVRAELAVPGQEYRAGQTVIMARDNAINRRVGYVIIGLPAMALQNTDGSPDGGEEFESDGVAVTSYTTDVIEQGETSETITVTGVGFTAAPASTAQLTVNPIGVTSTVVTFTVTAASDATVGLHNLTIGSATLRNVIRVTAASDFLYLFTDLSSSVQGVTKLNPTTGAVLYHTTPAGMGQVTMVGHSGAYVYVNQWNQNYIGRFLKSDGGSYQEKPATGIFYLNTSAPRPMLHDGRYLWITTGTGINQQSYLKVWDWDTDTIAATIYGDGQNFAYGMEIGGNFVYSLSQFLKVINPSTYAVENRSFGSEAGGTSIAWDGTFLYRPVTTAANTIKKYAWTPWTGVAVASTATLPAAATRVFCHAGWLYAMYSNVVVRIDPATMTIVATSSAFPRALEWFVVKGSKVWAVINYGSATPSLARLDATTLATEQTYTAADLGGLRASYAVLA